MKQDLVNFPAPQLSIKQYIALELTKQLINQGTANAADLAIKYSEQIIAAEKQSIGFARQ